VNPQAGSTWASSKFVVCVSSSGTAQRMMTGRLVGFGAVASSISRVNWWMFGGMKSHTRIHTRSPARRVAMYAMPASVNAQSSSGTTPKASVNW